MSYLDQLFSLEGKSALVTGAGRGLGYALAEALLNAGAAVTITGSNAERLEKAYQSFQAQGLPVGHCCYDLSESGQLEDLVTEVSRTQGTIDVLVNNAGVTYPHPLSEYPTEDWQRTLRMNLEVPFELSKRFGTMMMERQRGSIINVTSIGAEVGFPDNPAYQAAKGGLKQLTRALAYDLGKSSVRVNNIGPGYFRTDMSEASWNDPQRRSQRSQRTILGRWGEPSDLAGAAVFLASDASSYMTGQSIYVDGGWLAQGM